MIVAFYKGTRPGLAGIYNRGVRIVTKGVYSHAELIFSDGISASASFADGGVRFKQIDYDPSKWDFVEIPDRLEPRIRAWFEDHEGDLYDILGNVHFLVPLVGDSKSRWCCSEALGAAIGIPDAWRFHPNSLYAILKFFEINQWKGLACQTRQSTSSTLQALVEPSLLWQDGSHPLPP